LERADLLSLLSSGSVCIRDRQRVLVEGPAQVFLDAERLLGLADCALDSWSSAQPTFRRTQLSSARVSLRRGGGDATLELSFSPLTQDASKTRVHRTSVRDFVTLVCDFAEALATQLECYDAEQRLNLRLRNLQRQVERLRVQVQDESEFESQTNPQPETYRRFVPRVRRAVGLWETGPKMRFMPRWVAAVPHIDLRATFLCGEQLLVGGSHETSCLRRTDGEIVWRRATRPAACVVTPTGLVRIEPDGQLSCHQLSDGEVRFRLAVTPRSSRSAAGSVLHGPGIPNVLALVEGDRHVTAIDLNSGTVRWRYSARRPGHYRLRRAGRLLLVAGGDPLIVALDGVSGEVIWKLRGRLPFSGDVAVDHDSAFALSGTQGGRYRLHRFNPFSGSADWEIELDERPLIGRAPLLTADVVIVPTVEQEGAGALAFDRQTGRKLWEYCPGLVSATSAWLCIDDCVVANSQSGVLLGLCANTGRVRFNHVFSSSAEADQPRRLEPVLRSGALFVPQQQVHVVRPRDGELLGTLPSDLIPDMIRVDERCDVYVAEESGHLAAFGAAPRLAVVR
jgi:outer membrane protein assembly factor BamB